MIFILLILTFSKHIQSLIDKNEDQNYNFFELEAGTSILNKKLIIGGGFGFANKINKKSRWPKLSFFMGNYCLFVRGDYVFLDKSKDIMSIGIQGCLPISYLDIILTIRD